MEREYFAIMKDRYVYLITETSAFDHPSVYVAAYPTGVFADSYVTEYLRELPTPNATYINSGVYLDARGKRWELAQLGGTRPNEKFCQEVNYPQPKGRCDVRYQHGYWEKYTKAKGWQRTYEMWKKVYE
jgi:hypothetical protein